MGGGISITSGIKARSNRWDGYDLDLERGSLLRVTIENGGEINVYTLDAHEVMATHAVFSFSTPPMAVAAYIGAMIT